MGNGPDPNAQPPQGGGGGALPPIHGARQGAPQSQPMSDRAGPPPNPPGAVNVPPSNVQGTHTSYSEPAIGVPIGGPQHPGPGAYYAGQQPYGAHSTQPGAAHHHQPGPQQYYHGAPAPINPHYNAHPHGGVAYLQTVEVHPGNYYHTLADGTTVRISEETLPVEHEEAVVLSKSLRIFSIIDVVLCVLYIITGLYWAMLAILGPIMGYVGAKNYSPGYTIVYFVFTLLNLVWKVAIFIINTDLFTRVLTALLVCVQIYIARLCWQFYKLIKHFSEIECITLRAFEGSMIYPARPGY